jgi:hypothetical protein
MHFAALTNTSNPEDVIAGHLAAALFDTTEIRRDTDS